MEAGGAARMEAVAEERRAGARGCSSAEEAALEVRWGRRGQPAPFGTRTPALLSPQLQRCSWGCAPLTPGQLYAENRASLTGKGDCCVRAAGSWGTGRERSTCTAVCGGNESAVGLDEIGSAPLEQE